MSFIFLRFLTKPPCGGLKYKIRKNKNNRNSYHIGQFLSELKFFRWVPINYSDLKAGLNQSTQWLHYSTNLIMCNIFILFIIIFFNFKSDSSGNCLILYIFYSFSCFQIWQFLKSLNFVYFLFILLFPNLTVLETV